MNNPPVDEEKPKTFGDAANLVKAQFTPPPKNGAKPAEIKCATKGGRKIKTGGKKTKRRRRGKKTKRRRRTFAMKQVKG
jgi:hypothetical protein